MIEFIRDIACKYTWGARPGRLGSRDRQDINYQAVLHHLLSLINVALKILVYQLHPAHSRGTQISVLTGNLEIKALTKFTYYQTLCLSVKCSIGNGMHGLLQKAGTRQLP